MSVKKAVKEELNEFGEKDIFCRKDKLAVLGTAQTLQATPWEDEGYEIWGVAQCVTFPVFKRADILFELHTRDYWADPNVIKRLKDWPGRMVMQDHYDEVPKSEALPFETLMQYRAYHRTSITYMLALAYYSFLKTGKPLHVGLFGIHMEEVREEYAEQRPCCEYWLGRMEHAGIDTFIAGGAILSAPFLYGYEKYNALVWKMRQRYDSLRNGHEVKKQEVKQKELEAAMQLGAVQESEHWLRLAQRGEITLEGVTQEMQEFTPPGVNTTGAKGE